jgi:hypothetical protein
LLYILIYYDRTFQRSFHQILMRLVKYTTYFGNIFLFYMIDILLDFKHNIATTKHEKKEIGNFDNSTRRFN